MRRGAQGGSLRRGSSVPPQPILPTQHMAGRGARTCSMGTAGLRRPGALAVRWAVALIRIEMRHTAEPHPGVGFCAPKRVHRNAGFVGSGSVFSPVATPVLHAARTAHAPPTSPAPAHHHRPRARPDRTGGGASHPTARTHTASSSARAQSGQVARTQHARTYSTLAPAFPPTRPLPHCNYSCAASIVVRRS